MLPIVKYIFSIIVKEHRFCTLVDTTNWVIIPPPEFKISANPSSIVLRPGEEKNVQLQIQGNADLQSDAIWGRLVIMAKIMYSYSSFLATKHPYLLRVLAPTHYF
jgi:hypothetical protein